uniref:Uncharacterized protein n=1 Tax=Chlamydia pneumoniae TaxID=83558 RepID=A0A0F7WVP7_CHLPN|nr:hypothetical protein BN1224_DC9_BH_00220 [Chlamydia pneumoniae]
MAPKTEILNPSLNDKFWEISFIERAKTVDADKKSIENIEYLKLNKFKK